MPVIRQDLRYVLPAQRRGRSVHLLAIVSLALGIGGNAIFFSWLDRFIFEPLPYEEPDRLVLLGEGQRGQSTLAFISMFTDLPTWADYRERSRRLSDWGALGFRRISLGQEEGSVPLFGARVTPGFFGVLGVDAALGRVFTDADGVEGGPGVALLSWDYRVRSMGEDSDPLGTVLTLDGAPYEVIGVLPKGFEFLAGDIEVWLPVRGDPSTGPRGRRHVISVARMAPGATMEEVRAEVARIARDLETEHPETQRGWEMRAYHMRTEFPDPQSRLHLATIQGMVFFVLLIACLNVAILLLARGEERRREMAVRSALGAGRLRILRQLMRESMVMASMGGLAGLLVAAVGIRLLARLLDVAVMPSRFQPALDASVLLFTLAITVFSGLVFGLAPALQPFRRDHSEVLKSGGGSTSLSRRRGRLNAVLVASEIGLCLVALGGGSILVRTFQSLRMGDPGFEPDGLLSVEFVIPSWKYAATDFAGLADDVQARTSELRGVRSAALVSMPPQSLLAPSDSFRLGGQPVESGVPPPRAFVLTASPDYLAVLGVPLVQGRFFELGDRADALPVAVVSRSLAEKWFGSHPPVGERITLMGTTREIVGMVEDVQQALVPQAEGSAEGTVYLPLAQAPTVQVFLLLRTDGDPLALLEPVHRAFAAIDPDLTIHAGETMQEYARRYTSPLDVISPLLQAFGLFALLLASLGTYGVVAQAVGQRQHELGIRLALGARPSEVVRMIAARGIVMSAAGLAVGVLLLIPVARLAGSILEGFALSTIEPLTLGVVGATLLVVTLAASVIPASRAARVDPMRVLKSE